MGVVVGVPVSAVLDGVLQCGTTDLAFRERIGWVLVNYKTGVVGEGQVERFVGYYARQVRTYARLWEARTGEKAGYRWLYFTDPEQAVAV